MVANIFEDFTDVSDVSDSFSKISNWIFLICEEVSTGCFDKVQLKSREVMTAQNLKLRNY